MGTDAHGGGFGVASVLRRWERSHFSDWLVPALGAALWSLILFATRDDAVALRRSLVFMGGPVLLLSGLHARTTGYLHASGRVQLLALPLRASQHFGAARRRHLRGLASSGAWGSVAIVLASLVGGIDVLELGLLADWLLLLLVAVGVEPLASGCAAWLGRKFPEGTTPHDLQRMLAGGWTLPEAAAHLYVPALGLGVAVGLALPGQLVLDRLADAQPVPQGLWVAAVLGVAAAILAFVAAPRLYARGVFEAVPLLAEATRSLAGPPVPDPAPGWIRSMPPVLRLVVLQFWRLTPVPTLRLALLLGVNVWLWLSDAALQPPGIAITLVVALLWLVPATRVSRARPGRARLCAALPLPPEQRTGSHRGAAALLWMPAAASLVSLVVRGVAA